MTATFATPLADAEIRIVAVGTFDIDYLLVRARDLDRALDVLRAARHVVHSVP